MAICGSGNGDFLARLKLVLCHMALKKMPRTYFGSVCDARWLSESARVLLRLVHVGYYVGANLGVTLTTYVPKPSVHLGLPICANLQHVYQFNAIVYSKMVSIQSLP